MTGRVDVTDLDADPLRQLSAWLDAARTAGQPMPDAMTIASATSDGVPSARLVVLRGLRRGLVFFTDRESDKGAELAANPQAAAVLHWLVPAHRQVRAAGPVEPVSQGEADEYWSARAPAVRLSAAASRQSRVIASRVVLESQVRDIQRHHPNGADLQGPRAGAAFGCCRPASSSGRNRPTASTTGSATARRQLDHRAPVAITIDGARQREGRHHRAVRGARSIALAKAARSKFGLWTPVDCPRSSLPFRGQNETAGSRPYLPAERPH